MTMDTPALTVISEVRLGDLAAFRREPGADRDAGRAARSGGPTPTSRCRTPARRSGTARTPLGFTRRFCSPRPAAARPSTTASATSSTPATRECVRGTPGPSVAWWSARNGRDRALPGTRRECGPRLLCSGPDEAGAAVLLLALAFMADHGYDRPELWLSGGRAGLGPTHIWTDPAGEYSVTLATMPAGRASR